MIEFCYMSSLVIDLRLVIIIRIDFKIEFLLYVANSTI